MLRVRSETSSLAETRLQDASIPARDGASWGQLVSAGLVDPVALEDRAALTRCRRPCSTERNTGGATRLDYRLGPGKSWVTTFTICMVSMSMILISDSGGRIVRTR